MRFAVSLAMTSLFVCMHNHGEKPGIKGGDPAGGTGTMLAVQIGVENDAQETEVGE